MVAVNKVDKPDANPDRVKQELSQREVIPSDWGGTHEFVQVSALERTGIDTLLETSCWWPTPTPSRARTRAPDASGTVIESRLDPGRGPVASLLVQRGTLHMSDVVVAGDIYGRVRAMSDYTGATLEAAGPSVPVEVLGLGGVVDAGERFRVVENERAARQLAAERNQRLRAEELANRRPVSLDDLFARIKEGGLKELNIIIKGDVQGSVGALVDALEKVEQTEVRLHIIHTGVGAINESDVMLASASQAIIIGFNVRPRPRGERPGRARGRGHPHLPGHLPGHRGRARRAGRPAGAGHRRGRHRPARGARDLPGQPHRHDRRLLRHGGRGPPQRAVRLLREGTVIHEGRIASLKRFNEDTREVAAGFECGVLIEDYNDVKEGDQLEVFELREVARTAQVAAPVAPAPPAAPAAAE